MIAVATPDGRVMFTNALFRSKLGYTEEELAGMYLSDVHPPDFAAEPRGVPPPCSAGSVRFARCPWQPRVALSSPSKPVVGLADGTASVRLRCQQGLVRRTGSATALQTPVSTEPSIACAFLLPDRIFFDVNDSFLDVLGYQREEVIGKTAQEMNLLPNQARQTAVAGAC